MPRVSLDLDIPTLLALLAAMVVAAVAILAYRRTLPAVSPATRLLLTVLRALTLAAIAFLLFQPVLRLANASRRLPSLAVVLDGTESMQLADGSRQRSDVLQSLLRSPEYAALRDRADVRLFTFGSTVSRLSSPDSLTFLRPVTDLATALDGLRRDHLRSPIDAALLLTDGAYNRGNNPVHSAGDLPFPLFTVGIGDTAERRDVLIARVAANSVVYDGTQSPVDVIVRSSGTRNETVEASLRGDGKVLSTARIRLAPGTRDYTVNLAYIPSGEGMKKYTVAVSPLPGETTQKNNVQPFFVRVLRSKVNVVIVGGGPSPDITTVRQALAEDERFSVSAFVERGGGLWFGPAPSPRALDSADCLVLIGFPTQATADPILRQVADRLSRATASLLYVGGRQVSYDRLRTLGEIVPFTGSMASPTERFLSPRPVDSQRSNPLLRAGASEGTDAWTRLPPLIGTIAAISLRPGATVLLAAQRSAATGADPLLVQRKVDRRRSVALIGYGVWRWRLMAQGRPETSSLLADFLGNAVEWLTSREEDKPLRVSPVRPVIAQGEPIELLGEVYDEGRRPIEHAQVRARVRSGDLSIETDLRPLGGGRYEGSIAGLPEGDYTLEATAQTDGIDLGKDSGRFSVGGAQLEYRDTRMNNQALAELADATGGSYAPAADFAGIADAILRLPTFVPRDVVTEDRYDIRTLPIALGLIVLLLAIEWVLRRRAGML